MQLSAGEDAVVGDADFFDFFEVEQSSAVGEGVQGHRPAPAAACESSTGSGSMGVTPGRGGLMVVQARPAAPRLKRIRSGQTSADSVRDKSARSIQIVSRVVRGCGP